jgi:hypothetical protein
MSFCSKVFDCKREMPLRGSRATTGNAKSHYILAFSHYRRLPTLRHVTCYFTMIRHGATAALGFQTPKVHRSPKCTVHAGGIQIRRPTANKTRVHPHSPRPGNPCLATPHAPFRRPPVHGLPAFAEPEGKPSPAQTSRRRLHRVGHDGRRAGGAAGPP